MSMISAGSVFFLYSAFLLCISCIIYYLSHRETRRLQNVVFLVILVNLMLSAVFAITNESFRGIYVSKHSIGSTILYASEMGYFILHSMLAPLYMIYILLVNGVALHRKRTFFAYLLFPLFLVEALILMNPISHVIFRLDENNNFSRGPFEIVIYIVSGLYLIVSFYFVFRYKRALTKQIFRALLYFMLLVVAGIVVQLLCPSLKVELFAEALSLMGSMLAIEVDNGLVDTSLGIYNRDAFIGENTKLLNTNHDYLVATIFLSNFRFYSRKLGAGGSIELQQKLMDALREMDYGSDIFRVGPDNFAMIVFEEKERNQAGLAAGLRDIFSRTWDVREMQINLSAVIHLARVPEEVSGLDEILDMADREFQPGAPGAEILSGAQLGYIREQNHIENLIRTALAEDAFQVFYQPIYDVETDKITAAEALLRLEVPGEGFIPPDHLIPVAEETGLIVEIGNVVLRKVCRFIQEYDLSIYGLKCIEVNLSLLQCLRGDLSRDFESILNEYGVRPGQINLEITESADTGTSQFFLENIQKLRDLGFRFSLDDYGTGYSNLSNIIHMDYVNIKCDKSILWDAADSEKSRILLVDTIHTMRNLHMNLIQEGVENEEQLKLVVDAGCNMIQGFYFSKPVPEKEFIAYISGFTGLKK